jgi:lysophospholipase L1-like esterase
MNTSAPFTILIVLISLTCRGQQHLPVYHDSTFNTYYHQRTSLFKSVPQTSDEIIFAGNSITDGGEWAELFNDKKILNRGISGDITAGLIHRLPDMAARKPAKVFLLIGTNDLARGIQPDSVIKNIFIIADYLKRESPSTKIFVQSILPVNKSFGKFAGHTANVEKIKKLNAALQSSANNKSYTYVDLHTAFSNKDGLLKEELTNDGLHLTGEGYLLWKHLLYPYVYDLLQNPAIIPAPQQLVWGKALFPLYDCKTIVVKDPGLNQEAIRLQQIMEKKGWPMSIKQQAVKGEPSIHLQIGLPQTFKANKEAYGIDVEEGAVKISANTPQGIFYALQTFDQLSRSGVMVPACHILDQPAFSWRGFMNDVGRNFQSMRSLKEQIDVMSWYKLNIFHFHFTEDVAWRLAIKQYPQLTTPETMLRNKGMYYTEAEMKELIRYCRERYITLVPEIDMPGHSAAFKRAMGFDMQSDSGLAVVKNILREFCATYDLPYIHIGADEVKITNKNFVPEVTALLESLGKTVIGWQPGGNFSKHTIRQLWMDDNGKTASDDSLKYIDSRHLYVNHMDPLEAVTTLFNRQLCDKDRGDAQALGATLCVWHDRAAANEGDILIMNPVYPGMLTFAERSWNGGGHKGWVTNNTNHHLARDFAAFENKLLDHHQQYFSHLPFPYAAQTSSQWKLYGPYDNGGSLDKKFAPEEKGFDENRQQPALEVTGGTIVLKHWWAPQVKAVLPDPKENSTWYATQKIWSDEERTGEFWIGFNNLSRSPASHSLPAGAWDQKQSAVWVNGKLIEPPKWQRAGQKGNSEIPLTDEGYEYREPTKILLNKGWNTVLIKAPVGSFKGSDWQNPVKWMFTFVEAPKGIGQ